MATTADTGGATAQAQEKAQEVAGQAREQAQQAAGQAKDQVRTQVDERSTQAGQQISQQASDIRTVGEKLREEGKDGPAKLADQAAERAERVGRYLEQSDADRILGDVEDFARQRPWAVIAGGIGLGLVASRFLKASQSDRYRSTMAQRQQGPYTGTGTSSPPMGGTGNGVGRGDRFQTGTGTGTGTAGTGMGTGMGTGNELSSGVTPAGAPIPATPATPPTSHPQAPPTGAR